MKRAAAGTYPTYKQAAKRQQKKASGGKPRAGYTSVARTRGAAVTGEMKYFDCTRTDSTIVAVTAGGPWPAGAMQDPGTTLNLGAAAVANPLCLFAPTVGSALNQRIGRSVLVRKIKVNGQIILPTSITLATTWQADAPYPPVKVRILLVQDMQTNAAQMTPSALLNPASDTGSTLVSYQNPNNFGRFRVLKDKYIVLDNTNFGHIDVPAVGVYVGSQGLVRNFKFNINFKIPVKVQFNATNGGTVADIVDNSFHIICASTLDVVSPQVPLINYYSRIAYKE